MGQVRIWDCLRAHGEEGAILVDGGPRSSLEQGSSSNAEDFMVRPRENFLRGGECCGRCDQPGI